MPVPTPITALTSDLTQALQEQINAVLCTIFQKNSGSIYFREAEPLAEFRQSLGVSTGEKSDNAALFEKFRTTVPFTSYADYLPFIQRFFTTPCKASTVMDLFSPGLPYFIAVSSATSSANPKYFPRYRHVPLDAYALSFPPDEKILSLLCTLTHSHVVCPKDDNNDTTLAEIPACAVSTGALRMYGLDVTYDKEIVNLRHSTHTSPFAVMYVNRYSALIFMHVLFALENRNLQVINALFGSYFRDYCLVLERSFEVMVNIIESGIVPDMAGMEHVKKQLQMHMKPNSERAVELKAIGKIAEVGWLKKLWPKLETVMAICSGSFENTVPELLHFIGPDVQLKTSCIGSSEAFFALAYDPDDWSLFKVIGTDEVIEFLDIACPERTNSLVHSWSVVPGRKYELVVTTRNGLWRYRMDDVVEVVGFDPRDGLPIVRYGERRGTRLLDLTESELRASINAASQALGTSVLEFCIAHDYRASTACHSFFVELQHEPGIHAYTAPKKLLECLASVNSNYLASIESSNLGAPNIRILRKGTFYEFREWRTRMRDFTSVQLKVPVVTWDKELINWLEKQVMEELKAE